MTGYLVIKWLHVLSSTLLFGTGIGTAYYMLCAARSGDAQVAARVLRHGVRADWIFTATTMVFQPLSGLLLWHQLGLPLATPWIAASLWLYALALACWLPVVWIQLRLRDLAHAAAASASPLPERFHALLRMWIALGLPAFTALLLVFWLMVAKPA